MYSIIVFVIIGCVKDIRAEQPCVCVRARASVCVRLEPGQPSVCSFCSPEGPWWVYSL